MCIYDRGDAVVVDMNSRSTDTLYTDDTFVFCFVCQHGAVNSISDRIYARVKANRVSSKETT